MNSTITGTVDGEDLEKLLTSGRDHLWMQDRRAGDLQSSGRYTIIAKAEGCYLYDIGGNRLIDGNSSGFVKAIGHRRPEIADAIADQLTTLAYAPISHGCATVPAIRLARKIADLSPGSLSRCFFCGGGAEAVEVAIQLARQYQYLSGKTQKTKIISRRPEYHGSTYATISLGSHADRNNAIFEPLMPGVFQVDAPHCYKCPWGHKDRSPSDCCMLSVASLRNIIAAEGAETIAAFIATPFRVGGSLPNPDYWPQVRQICNEAGIVLIADEVTLAFGRAGTWFGMERFNVVPDIMVIGKGLTSGELPVGGLVATKEIADAFDQAKDGLGNFYHGVTFGSHAAVMAAGLKNLEIIEREGLVENSNRMGSYFYERVTARLLDRHPIVGAVFGGMGLILSIALVKNRRTRQAYPGGADGPFLSRLNELVRSNGLFLNMRHTTNIAPPLIATKQILDDIVDILDHCFSQIEREFPPED
jgi:adenosylmethionine-8-amino-7-oxononanoate aminotransferase